MKCPRQKAFAQQLDELLTCYYDSMEDRFSVDEQDLLIDKFVKRKNKFINLWCPVFKEYEEFDCKQGE